ncbi:MAG: disulfide bond formation protein B [Burkholderiales bacterium]|nr:disulfide bond formation protein B [Burkholderiales bacterium]
MTRLPPRLWFIGGMLSCAGLLAFAYYLQYVVGLEPCPLCMLQRVAFFALGLVLLIAALHGPRAAGARIYASAAALAALTGAGLAARHVWLQYNPPKFASCAGDIYSQLERLPLGRVIANALHATGDCAKVDWSLLGLSIAEWSLVWFALFAAVSLAMALRPQAFFAAPDHG